MKSSPEYNNLHIQTHNFSGDMQLLIQLPDNHDHDGPKKYIAYVSAK